jgi:hypothetical protein
VFVGGGGVGGMERRERVGGRELGWVGVRGVDVYVHFAHNRNSGCNCQSSHRHPPIPLVSYSTLSIVPTVSCLAPCP